MATKISPFKVLTFITIIIITFFLLLELFSTSLSSNENIVGEGKGIKAKVATPGGMIISGAKAIFSPTPKPSGDPTVLDNANADDEGEGNGDADASGDDEESEKDTEGNTYTGEGCLVDC